MRKPPNYWTYDKIKNEALKYDKRGVFKKKCSTAYSIASKNGWLNGICKHMLKNKEWSYSDVKEEALKYKSRLEFQKLSNSAYGKAYRNKWLDDICEHMTHKTTLHERIIYAYEFEDNHVYVGLTYNLNVRNEKHLNSKNSAVYIHLDKTKSKYILKRLTNNPVSIKEAIILEEKYLLYYMGNGWKILNRIKTGGLGGNIIKWDYNKIKKEAFKYNSRSEFQNGSRGAYKAAQRNGWLDGVCEHMIELKKPNGYWTYNKIEKIALNYTIKLEFKKENAFLYKKAQKNGWLDDICKHMLKNKDWTYSNIQNEALKYKSRSEFQKNSGAAYTKAYRNEWLDDICKHMNIIYKDWSYNDVKNEALKYSSRFVFFKKSPAAYAKAQRNKWLDEVCSHM